MCSCCPSTFTLRRSKSPITLRFPWQNPWPIQLLLASAFWPSIIILNSPSFLFKTLLPKSLSPVPQIMCCLSLYPSTASHCMLICSTNTLSWPSPSFCFPHLLTRTQPVTLVLFSSLVRRSPFLLRPSLMAGTASPHHVYNASVLAFKFQVKTYIFQDALGSLELIQSRAFLLTFFSTSVPFLF